MAHKPYSALARRVRRCQRVQSSNHEGVMSKGMDQKKNQKKNQKKEPTKTLKEKRAAKQEKRGK
ncbi:hypothetical protein IB69_011120 [Xanthomonas citri]|uniref:hypothetical protein n=1 Tax=Xanthomonas citri TaxID=346 RepID=UPI0006E50766|nr:hypothetical protein [Xanthomonas citri]MBO9753073.1 hypothetical protein [Xanthomonas phaseoli pv. dieffenbachiae]OQP76269.1 hypothetical protein IB69_011120 [Xanthomonas citri]